MQTDMSRVKRVHFVGIGGCGMSAIAKILKKKGFIVSGSDVRDSANTIRLKDIGVQIFIDHVKSNVRGSDLIVVSSAIPKNNVEIEEAIQSGIPVEKRASMLSWIMDQFSVRIAVAGTHGKTTTTSMITTILSKCSKDPTFLIGGEANDVDGNARLGSSQYVVAEADESDKSFLELHPNIAVITNVEADHMENYGTFDKVVETFIQFADIVPNDGLVVIGGKGPGAEAVKKAIKCKNVITYGLSKDLEYWADNFKFSEKRAKADIHLKTDNIGEATLCVPGQQNIENALASIAVARHVGCDMSCIISGLQYFTGAKRRFQILGEVDGIIVVDDYGHHPTEVTKTLEAARLGYPDRKIICIFQPHRFTRTMHLFEEFGTAFGNADMLYLTEIYSAGENAIEGISGRSIYKEVEKHNKNVKFVKRKEQIVKDVIANAKSGDIIITMGAGDINTIGKEILNRLRDHDIK